ncbi:hypothetical protein NMY22_g17242 [Coprinellus aureogranulatus]|nr:hypothetical protein NMY22_g17242 [Coprinellus aureogranulatus]
MQRPELDSTAQTADAHYAKATKAELSRQFNQAFQYYVKSAELYLHLSGLEGVKEKDKATWKGNAQKALDRAEKIKSFSEKANARVKGVGSERKPLDGESAEVRLTPVAVNHFAPHELYRVLKKGAQVNDLVFPPWDESSPANVQEGELFTDPDGQPKLSPEQTTVSAVWRRPNVPACDCKEVRILPEDILQHVVTDCSVCASISVCLEHSRRFGTHIAETPLHHYCESPETCKPVCVDHRGRLDFKFIFNGAWRRVVIDDQLPYDPQKGTLMCMSVLAETPSWSTLWPSLLEKAYMKLMGGYDFPGSNSCIDLHAIAGWIPEHIETRRPDFERERTWERLLNGFTAGRCMVTLGTGPRPISLDERLKLLPSHSYAVTDVSEGEDGRTVTILDSWVTPGTESSERLKSPTLSWDDALNMFDGIYISWDPAMFKNSLTFHGMWKRNDPEDGEPFADYHSVTQVLKRSSYAVSKHLNMIFTNESPNDEEVWILLTRHTPDTRRNQDFIALRVQVEDESHTSTTLAQQATRSKETYTNSTHILVRTRLSSTEHSGIFSILASYDGDSSEVGFTVSAYAPKDVDIRWDETVAAPPYTKNMPGAITKKTAGGNCTHRSFMVNPQYHLRILPPPKGAKAGAKAQTCVSVQAGKDMPMNVAIVWGQGKRVTELSEQDTIASSGAYTYGSARVSKDMAPGDSTIVVSAFDPQYLGPFTLKVECTFPFDLVSIPPEGAMMYDKEIIGSWERDSAGGNPSCSTYTKNPRYEVDVPVQTKCIIRLQLTHPSQSERLNVTLFSASPSGKLTQHVATSGPYSDALAGVVIPQTTLSPGRYWVVPSTYKAGVEAEFRLVCYFSSKGVEVGEKR